MQCQAVASSARGQGKEEVQHTLWPHSRSSVMALMTMPGSSWSWPPCKSFQLQLKC